MDDNPLAEKQRETKGAETFGKYDYQYHWALCRLLEKHEENTEYAIFVEHHEDVVLASSLDVNTARFEFNQVKCITGSRYTLLSLTKIPSNSNNSILGKLLKDGTEKSFHASIDAINLVATNGFNNDINAKGLKLQVITKADFSEEALNAFLEKMKNEISIEEIPDNLCFIVPELPSQGHQEHVIGRVSNLIEKLFPQSPCKPSNIYRLLIDELHRKGQITYDYAKWNQLIKNKALTSKTVHDVIVRNTDIGGMNHIKVEVDNITKALGIPPRASTQLRQSVVRYSNNHVIRPSAIRLMMIEYVRDVANDNPSLEYVDLFEVMEQNVPEKIKKYLIDTATIKAAIIYELIQVENGE
jgi:hypothetical protein